MPVNSNFSVKWTLDEADTARRALEERRARLLKVIVADMTEDEREEVGRIDTMLRRDF
jgi:hypothetical protein